MKRSKNCEEKVGGGAEDFMLVGWSWLLTIITTTRVKDVVGKTTMAFASVNERYGKMHKKDGYPYSIPQCRQASEKGM